MRVVCENLEDFTVCINHELENDRQIFDDVIRVDKHCVEKNEAVVEVYVQVCAIVGDKENSYLIEAAEFCGIDRPCEEGVEGTDMFEEKKSGMVSYTNGIGAVCLPGRIEI